MSALRPLIRDAAGNTAVEFAFVAPPFMMFIFLLLDGGRMIFTKQAVNELAMATARCRAIKSTSCTSDSAAQSWAVSQARTRSNLTLATSNVTITPSTTCKGVDGMTKAMISLPYNRGALALLPQAVVPTSLVASACFPAAS